MLRECLVLLTLPFVFITNSLASADNWEKYTNITDKYYRLDHERFDTVSCQVDVPVISNGLEQLRTQLEQVKNNVVIEESLKNFTISYHKAGGLIVNRPTLNVKVISEEGLKDPGKVKQGIEMINSGFKAQVDGVGEQLQGIFEGFETPKKDKYNISKISENNGVYVINYEKDGSNFVETHREKQIFIEQNSRNGGKLSSIENYNKMHNKKLVFTDGSVSVNQPMLTADMDLAVSYQSLRNFLFPSTIKVKFNQTIQTIKQESSYEIYFNKCTVR